MSKLVLLFEVDFGVRERKIHPTSGLRKSPGDVHTRTVSFHNFKSQNFKLSVSNPKKQIRCSFVRTVSNFKLPESRPQKQT